MLIQSHSLLAKLLDSMLCQKTLVSLGATALPSHVGSERGREGQRGEGACQPPALGGEGKWGEATPMTLPKIRSAL